MVMPLDAIKELERLVAYKTLNDPAAKKKPTSECPKYINSKLKELGFIIELFESEGFYTCFARRGQGKFKILFLAHFDVVPLGEGWKSDPFKLKVEGDRAYGRGTCDNKGNIVSLLLLAEKLVESDLPCMVMISASGDEEIGGANGARYLRDHLMKQGLFPDYVVIADGLDQQVIHKRRNALPSYFKLKKKPTKIIGQTETIRFKTETFGSESRHSAYMRLGVDRHAMLAASKYLDLHPETVVQDVRGAFVKSNVVPDWVELDLVHPDQSGKQFEYDSALTDLMRALLAISQAPFPTEPSDKGIIICPNLLWLEKDLWTLYCDVRAMTNDGNAVHEAFSTALQGKVDIFSIQVSPGAGYVDSDPNQKFIHAAIWALEKEGIHVKLIEGFGASDSRYFAKSAQTFDFGPRGGNAHGPNEWVSISSIKKNAQFFHALIEVLTRDKSPIRGPT